MKKETKKTLDTEMQNEEKGQELDMEELGNVAGGVNPFANISRVPDQNLDDKIRNNV